MMKILLTRKIQSKNQTIGDLKVIKDNRILFKCRTAENGKILQLGKYKLKFEYFDSTGKRKNLLRIDDAEYCIRITKHFMDENVIHVGKEYLDTNEDDYLKCTYPKETLKQLIEIIEEDNIFVIE
jgi:hypothetical protein